MARLLFTSGAVNNERRTMSQVTDHTKALQYTGGLAVIVTEDGTLECPVCHDEDYEFRYLEDIVCHREVSGIFGKTLNIHGHYETGEGYDDGKHPRLECRACFNEFELPEGYELDFI
jgi:hypothetical protein